MTDKFHEECGVFGIYGHTDAATLTILSLHSLQHRGQEASGIVTYDGFQFHIERHIGLIGDTFTKPSVINRLPGYSAIGHNRYSTTGEEEFRNVQPFFADFAEGGFAVAHNGNLTNAAFIRHSLQKRGAIFHSTSDTEVILHLIAMSSEIDLVNRLIDAIKQIEGAFSLVALSSKILIGCRDSLGVRPLVLGNIEGSYVLASETCALDIIGARYIRDIKPGELIVITESKIEIFFPFDKKKPRFCVFEYVYFARPDSIVEGKSVYAVRKRIGKELARESSIDADIIVPVPDSGTPVAIGFAQEAQIPFELGIIRNHYVGRTFISPTENIRHMGVKLKYNANRKLIEGKRVILVDDSIVRGTTSQKIVAIIRDAGALEVHMCIASPPTISGCYYGVDTPEKKNLLASHMNIEEIAEFLKVDSLSFLTIDGLYQAVSAVDRNNQIPQFCDACFTGEYPTNLTDREEMD
ncbi:amidophosphoribosyltransferase [Candidatus Endowatersipora endosymbiont of Watersipora subatra]|uniref:amidophosphoribosyltransferase n=1 Tax=Candidatus Endowatersipora endosymbiont of Watersipora subatra TaxID=3077946 RepID=UPI00312C8D46